MGRMKEEEEEQEKEQEEKRKKKCLLLTFCNRKRKASFVQICYLCFGR